MQTMPVVDFDSAPFLVIWETTQACDLACQHCRASAQPDRHPGELSTEEARVLLRDVAGMGTPVFIFSGGDPAKRTDLCELVRYGKELGLRVGTIPAASPTLGRQQVFDLKEAGLDQMAVSLDFPREDLHDEFRAVPGAFAKTLQAMQWAHEAGLPLQVNTTICGKSFPYFAEMAEFVKTLGIVFWEVFFLVPMGRGETLGGLTAEQCEEAFAILYEVQRRHDFIVKVTEAPHYRRYVAEQEAAAAAQGDRAATVAGHPGGHPAGAPIGMAADAVAAPGGRRRPAATVELPEQLRRSEGPGHTVGFAPRAVNSGNGFAFVSHTGEVFPSGFLPTLAGNVRQTPFPALYRDTEVFRRLRQPDLLLGRCGRCEYRAICGGSRSRAYALTGNELATDPWCAYIPAADRR